jgi:hypothetical protein
MDDALRFPLPLFANLSDDEDDDSDSFQIDAPDYDAELDADEEDAIDDAAKPGEEESLEELAVKEVVEEDDRFEDREM